MIIGNGWSIIAQDACHFANLVGFDAIAARKRGLHSFLNTRHTNLDALSTQSQRNIALLVVALDTSALLLLTMSPFHF